MAADALGSRIKASQDPIFTETYSSMGGVDIKAVFSGVVFGNLQAISYSVTREKVIR